MQSGPVFGFSHGGLDGSYGNYVLQHILQLKNPDCTNALVTAMKVPHPAVQSEDPSDYASLNTRVRQMLLGPDGRTLRAQVQLQRH